VSARRLATHLFAGLLLALSPAARAEDDADDEAPDDLDAPAKPASPREGTFLSVTLPLGYGVGGSGGGVAYGVAGALGGGPVSLPLYLVLADGGHAGGQYMTGVRYNAPKLFYVEALVGWAKPYGTAPASLAAGAGGGVDIPVYRRFTVTAGGTVAYAFAQSGVFGMVFAGPTLHL
jgi:hypothetical protein